MSEGYLEFYRGEKVLVTGGLGFIGINTCLRLLELGAEVTALDNFIPPDLFGRIDLVSSGLRIAVADIRDEEKLERVALDQHELGSEAVYRDNGRDRAYGCIL
jgi:nucleoside-diphosphate-sugar epimerase